MCPFPRSGVGLDFGPSSQGPIMTRPLALALLVAFTSGATRAQEKFRTDGGDETLPWLQLREGEFPPEGSAHYFSGELIRVDHLERVFVLRVDRTDAQKRSQWDLPAGAKMLPFGSIHRHGAPAALCDIPLGTHLHGWFYTREPKTKDVVNELVEEWYKRGSLERNFTRCLRLEDDFSHHTRLKQAWRIDAVAPVEMKLTATLIENGAAVGKPKVFDLLAATRVWKGQGVAALKDLAPGLTAQINLNWATLYGPGRIREIWIDEDSRKLATAHQAEVHKQHVRERGLAGWIDEVDNKNRIVTITFFGGVDPSLFDALTKGSTAGLAAAEPTLLTYDPVNDRKSGPILEVEKVPAQAGSAGVRIKVQPSLLLEGFRPKRIVRVFPAGWPVQGLPSEEHLSGRE